MAWTGLEGGRHGREGGRVVEHRGAVDLSDVLEKAALAQPRPRVSEFDVG